MHPKLLSCILLLDDDSINNFINHRMIKSLDCTETIHVAKSGYEALTFLHSYLRENKSWPDLILIDLNMPGMDGFEFIEKFKNIRNDEMRKTVLVVLTTSSNPRDIARVKDLGIEYFFNKPLMKEELEKLLTKEFNYKKTIKNTFAVPVIPLNEEDRLKAVNKYRIINTDPEEKFNSLVEEAAIFFNVPIALVSIVDYDKVWFKANVGMNGVQFAERGVSLCSLAILQDQVTVFSNAEEDPCLIANPLVHGPFGLKFYAGAPITNNEGYHIGTFCIVDKKPRTFSESDKAKLSEFASLAMERIEARLLKLN